MAGSRRRWPLAAAVVALASALVQARDGRVHVTYTWRRSGSSTWRWIRGKIAGD